MNGAEALVRTLVRAGVEVCFSNPGTSELHVVAALDRVPGLRPILGLFEGVVTGAADGYARMAGKPAATLLHLGPGLGNGLANLHNAKKAHSPVVNLVGDHATHHARFDAPLSSDVTAIAQTVSGWVRRSDGPERIATDTADAVAAALGPPGQIATLVVPADVAWRTAPNTIPEPASGMGRAGAASASVAACAKALRSGAPTGLLVSGPALGARGIAAAKAIAESSGARLFCDTFNARLARGAGVPMIAPLPYFAEPAIAALDGLRQLLLVGTQAPVAFFAYPERPSRLAPDDCEMLVLAERGYDGTPALEELAEALGADPSAAPKVARAAPERPNGPLDLGAVARSLAALLPEGAIVSDESITASAALFPLTQTAAPHDWLFLTGGAIGQGLPLATGAAVACPDRKLVSLEGDGSAMYTLQSLWTQAREKLDVTTIILANRRYAILNLELGRLGVTNPGEKARSVLDIDAPRLDWVKLAEAQGVEASRASSAEAFHQQLDAAFSQRGPRLIEAVC
jgi:acetolactate synthase-1/2/3 large subunit